VPEKIQISLIIPVLNEEKLIGQTLSQFTPALKDKYGIEVIVSDGGSSDNTVSIATPLADKIIKANSSMKQNIAIGRNSGAAAAVGEIFYLMNGDTRIKDIEEFFRVTLKEFKNERVIALTCKVKVFPEDELLRDRMFHFCYNNYVRILNSIGMGMGRGECHIIRNKVFNSAGGYNEMMAAGEDYDLYRRIAKTGKIKFLGKHIVYESPRRYRKFGYRKVFWDWTKNAASVLFKNKAISKVWEPIR
jgi:glycosyltransferase involved in cell wall biosynthesis